MELAELDQNTRRPVTVVASIVCVSAAFAKAPLTWVFTLHWHEPLAVLAFIGINLLHVLVVWSLYMRRNWARWLIVLFTGVVALDIHRLIFLFAFTFNYFVNAAQFVLYVAAGILLLCPASRRWYSNSYGKVD